MRVVRRCWRESDVSVRLRGTSLFLSIPDPLQNRAIETIQHPDVPSQHDATVNADHLAGDVRSARTREERRQIGDLLFLRERKMVIQRKKMHAKVAKNNDEQGKQPKATHRFSTQMENTSNQVYLEGGEGWWWWWWCGGGADEEELCVGGSSEEEEEEEEAVVVVVVGGGGML